MHDLFPLSPGACSEGLASAQLELHGLQGMLESLQAWVAEADRRMTETEAAPIATDIETVERQLANHEVGTSEWVLQPLHACRCTAHSFHPYLSNLHLTKPLQSVVLN